MTLRRSRGFVSSVALILCVECVRGIYSQSGTTPDPELVIVQPINSPIEIAAGKDFIIQCRLLNYQNEPSVLWELDRFGTLIEIRPDNPKYELREEYSPDVINPLFTLKVINVSFYDMGDYSCNTNVDNLDVSASLEVKVHGTPNVTAVEQFVSVEVGTPILLVCSYEARPKPVWSRSKWDLVGVRKLYNGTRYHIYHHSSLDTGSDGVSFGTFSVLIFDPQIEDIGRYACFVNSPEGTGMAHIDMHVGKGTQTTEATNQIGMFTTADLPTQVPAPFIHMVEPKHPEIQIGPSENLRIVCFVEDATGLHRGVVSWHFIQVDNFELHLASDIYETMFEGVTITTWSYKNSSGIYYTLLTYPMTFNHTGTYTCQLDALGNLDEVGLHVTVEGRPVVSVDTRIVKVSLYGSVTLSCQILGNPLPETQWYKDTYELSDAFSSGVKINNVEENSFSITSTLTLQLQQTSDYGNYICEAINKYGRNSSIIVVSGEVPTSVTFGPLTTTSGANSSRTPFIYRIQPTSSPFIIRLSGRLLMECKTSEVVWNSNVRFEWDVSKNRRSVAYNSSQSSTRGAGVTVRTWIVSNGTRSVLFLEANPVTFNETGIYTCRVNKGGLIDEASLHVKVEGEPVVDVDSSIVNAVIEQELTLSCHITALPLPNVTWYKETNFLYSGAVYTIEDVLGNNGYTLDSRLIISNFILSNFGSYQCRAKNKYGTRYKTIVVKDDDNCRSSPCTQFCTDTFTAYECDCAPGWQLALDGYSCKDEHSETTVEPGGEHGVDSAMSQTTLFGLAGGGVGGVVLLSIIILVALCYKRRRRRPWESNGEGKAVFNNAAYTDAAVLRNDMNNPYTSLKGRADEFPRARLQLGNEIGRGQFGKIIMGRALSITGTQEWEPVALKTYTDTATDAVKQDLLKELSIMRKIPPNLNVISYYGCCTLADPVYIIMEYMPKGNLQEYLRSFRSIYANTPGQESVSTPNAQNLSVFALQIAKGMEHIAAQGIIHRDLAARNVLIGDGNICKICDFGLARDVEGSDVYEITSKGPLPIRWMSPESLQDSFYTSKSDVYSFSILLWEIVTLGATPYPGIAARDVMENILRGKRLERPVTCTEDLYRLMCRCWQMAPRDRPSFSEIVQYLDGLLERDGEYIQMDQYSEGVYDYIDPNITDERV